MPADGFINGSLTCPGWQRQPGLDESEGFRHAVGVQPVRETTGIRSASRHSTLIALVAIVVLIALPIRLYLASSAAMISRDGASFIWYAQALADDPIAEMRRQAQHPLYPALVWAAHRVAGGLFSDPVSSWQVPAMAVTLVGGLAVVVATYALASIVFDRRIGLIAALLAATAAELCQLSADALTDMPHLALYLFAMAAAVRGVRDRARTWLFAAGVLSGLAFLIRPEGAEVAVVTAVLLLCVRGWPSRQRLVGLVVLVLGAGLVASPYMMVTGKLVQKKSVKQFFGGNDESASVGGRGSVIPSPSCWTRAARAEARGSSVHAQCPPEKSMMIAGAGPGLVNFTDLARALARITENWFRSLRVTFLLPAILWLIRRRDIRGEPLGIRLIAAAVGLHVLILVGLLIRFDYWDLFSLRHVTVLAGLSLPFSAAGVAAILTAVARARRRAVALVLAVAMIAPTLPWLLETRHADRAYLRRTGEWIRTHGDAAPRIMSTRHRVAFYANGIHVRSPLGADPERILAEARSQKPDWLVFDQQRMLKAAPSFFKDLEQAVGAGERLEPVPVESGPDRKGTNRAIVYRYRAPP